MPDRERFSGAMVQGIEYRELDSAINVPREDLGSPVTEILCLAEIHVVNTYERSHPKGWLLHNGLSSYRGLQNNP
jgi:hypothetical protein